MKIQIDVKSALCGLVLGVVAMLAIGATDPTDRPVGRYYPACGAGNLIILADTVTGQVWAHRPEGLSVSGSAGGFFDKKVDK